MARFQFDYGRMEGLTLSLERIAKMPEETIKEIVAAGANVVMKEQQRIIIKLGIYETGTLHGSIQTTHRRTKYGDRFAFEMIVYPYGTRKYYMSRVQEKLGYGYKYGIQRREARKYTTGGKRKAVTNNDVGFIHEFGAPRKGIKPKQWMKQANINAEEAMVQAEFEVYDRYLKSQDL